MHTVSLADQHSRMGPASTIYALTDALGASDLALNYYELAPGESTAYGYHSHAKQEEVFYVQSGELTFRTADGDVTVAAGELVRFGPGEFQRSRNTGDDTAVVLAMGAPQDAGETVTRRECEECGGETTQSIELAEDGDAVLVRCDECGETTGRYE
ncbi:putative cupin superfamily protein [Halarchaeum rubridurum]|uniref:Cupin n=1 Tax=Halarchaeum rubridurum TaxID=489911 RepID=A0A830FTW9_9EURY|nr:cupin domain-containing protein [Halarchaeum rubridurum]MBP1954334.1 putative cupin superfamily protein [Halarchaeum rubridurum]GGM59233.1 cupin [Halarchaeum rubridurum]